MADNQTRTIMKNVILTHKELQMNLFEAFTAGVTLKHIAPDLYLYIDYTDREFIWKVTRHHQEESSALAKVIFQESINKGEYEMNDIRLGVTIQYLRDRFRKFESDLKEHLKNKN